MNQVELPIKEKDKEPELNSPPKVKQKEYEEPPLQRFSRIAEKEKAVTATTRTNNSMLLNHKKNLYTKDTKKIDKSWKTVWRPANIVKAFAVGAVIGICLLYLIL